MQGARLIPLHEFPARIEEIATLSRAAAHAGADPRCGSVCGSGFRASIATSLLARAGIPVVAVDDHFHKAAAAGLPIVRDNHAVMLGDAYAD